MNRYGSKAPESAADHQGEGQVLPDRQGREEGPVLGDVADAALGGLEARHVAAQQGDRPRLGQSVPGEDLLERQFGADPADQLDRDVGGTGHGQPQRGQVAPAAGRQQ